jgi:flotillin
VTGVAQVKVMGEECFLNIALEQFLKNEQEIKTAILHTIEGRLRAIVGELTVEEIYKWRRKCAQTI